VIIVFSLAVLYRGLELLGLKFRVDLPFTLLSKFRLLLQIILLVEGELGLGERLKNLISQTLLFNSPSKFDLLTFIFFWFTYSEYSLFIQEHTISN